MLKLRVTNWTKEEQALTTFVLEGDTFPVKDKIKKFGFRWGFPTDLESAIVKAHGADVLFAMRQDPMFRCNRAWSVTCAASLDRSEWIAEVCETLNAVLEK